jgi:hypothetical protein
MNAKISSSIVTSFKELPVPMEFKGHQHRLNCEMSHWDFSLTHVYFLQFSYLKQQTYNVTTTMEHNILGNANVTHLSHEIM